MGDFDTLFLETALDPLDSWYYSVVVAFETMTKKGKTMKTLGYLRVSHLESLNGTSFDTQEKKIQSYCQLHDFT